jgi:resuscitation-promoting factor RpfB
MAGRISGLSVFYASAGGVLLWSGIKGQSIADTIHAITSGNSAALSQQGSETVGTPQVSVSPPNAASSDVAAGTSLVTGTAGQAGGNAKQNQALAKLLLVGSHPSWATGQEWQDLVNLWNQESGWSNKAQNPTSGAYGIPQALPYTKMPKSAWPPSAGGSANAAAQISWGLAYIAQRYGSPSAAWAHEQANNWY